MLGQTSAKYRPLKKASWMIFLLFYLPLTACATVVNDSHEPLTITTNPPMAKVTIKSKDGVIESSGLTPTTLYVKRGGKYTIQISKDGYRSQTTVVDSHFEHWAEFFLGNIWWDLLPGMIVDLAKGSTEALDKNVVSIKLKQIPGYQNAPKTVVSNKDDSGVIIRTHRSSSELMGSAPASPALSEIKQLIEAQNKEIQNLKSNHETSASQPSSSIYKSSVDRPDYHLPRRPNDFALVIGVEKYPGGIPKAEFADRDAKAVVAHLRALGVPLRHIKRLTDDTATRSRIKGALHWLTRNVTPGSTVYVYFSGHGAPSQGGTAYLVPFDGDPSDLSDTGVSTSGFYRTLGQLPARHIIVALDACFTGEGKRSIMGNGIRPLVTKIREGAVPSSGKLVVLTAARSNQESGVLEAKGHGLFTYYFLKGLNGGAEHGGHVTVAGLYRYLKPKVEAEANLDNRSQTPELEPQKSSLVSNVVLR